MTIGAMAMPLDFKYKDVFLHGRPQHQKFDDFWIKHPPMDTRHRAKIFSPFDALAGFDEAISSKLILYTEQRSLSDEEKEKIDAALAALHSLTYNSRVARLNRPQATVTYFIPCSDPHSEWYGVGGTYQTVTGTVLKVDSLISRTLLINDQIIPLDSISEITITPV